MLIPELFRSVQEAIKRLEIVLPHLETDGFNQDYLVDALDELKDYERFLRKQLND